MTTTDAPPFTHRPPRRIGRRPEGGEVQALVPKDGDTPVVASQEPAPLEAELHEPEDKEEEEKDEEEADEEEEEEDDEPQEEARASSPVSPPRRPFGTPATGTSPQIEALASSNAEVRNRQVQRALRIDDDLTDILEGLEFGESSHEVKLVRLRSNPPGYTKGNIDTFYRKITTPEIKELYGGGEFKYTVIGPDPMGRRVIKGSKTIAIEGPSLVNGVAAPMGIQPNHDANMAKDLIKAALDQKDREAARLTEEIKTLRESQMQLLTRDTTGPLVQVMKENADKELQLKRDALAAEERRAAAELAEKRRLEDLESKRVETLRREEREARDEEKKRAAGELNTTLQLMKANTDVLIASFKESAQSKEQGFATILQTIQAANAQQAQVMQANFAQQMDMSRQQMQATIQQITASADMREKLVLDALKDAKSAPKASMREQIAEFAALKQGLDVLTGGAGQSTGDGIMAGVKDIANSPFATNLVQAFIGNKGPAPGQQVQMQPSNQPVAYGLVQVSGPPAAPKKEPSPWPVTTWSQQTASAAPKPAAPQVKARPKVQVPVMGVPPVVPPPVVPLVQVMAETEPSSPASPTAESLNVAFPSDQDPQERKFELLIRALDAAIRADWTPEQMFGKIVMRFPSDIVSELKKTPFDQCLKTIELFAPESVLGTAQGVTVMRKLFDLLGGQS